MRYTFISGGERIGANDKKAALALCLSGRITLDAQVIEHTNMGDRISPLAHLPRFRSAAQSAFKPPAPPKEYPFLKRPLFFICAFSVVSFMALSQACVAIVQGRIAVGRRGAEISREFEPDIFWISVVLSLATGLVVGLVAIQTACKWRQKLRNGGGVTKGGGADDDQGGM